MPPTDRFPPTGVAASLASTDVLSGVGTSPDMTPRQRAELDAWKAEQLAKAPQMDEATARRVSAALWPIATPARQAHRSAA